MGFWQSLFLLFCAVVFALWLIGWGILIAEKMSQRKQRKFSKWFKSLIETLEGKYLVLLIPIILTGCVSSGSVQTRIECPPMLREATYRAMQADEVADYRIAVEKCK